MYGIISVKMFPIFALFSCLFVVCVSVPLDGTVSSTTVPVGTGDPKNSTSPTPSTTPILVKHRILKIKAKPKKAYLPTNGTLMISGDSTMRVFDYHEIIHPKFDPSNFLKQAAKESTQKIEVPLNYGQHYFIFLPPALIKEYQKFATRKQKRRRRFKRHHPSILQSVLGELQDYALVPIQSNTGHVRYVLLKNPKFVISGVGPNGKPVSASIPVTQQPNNPLSMVQPQNPAQSQSHHIHHSGDLPNVQVPPPTTNQNTLPKITDLLSPLKISPAPKVVPPTPAPRIRPSRNRPQRLTRNNRPFSASVAKKAILGDKPSSNGPSRNRIIVPKPSSLNRFDSIGRRGPSRNKRPRPNLLDRTGSNRMEQSGLNRGQRPGQNSMERPRASLVQQPEQNTFERPGSNRVEQSGLNRGQRPGQNSIERPRASLVQQPERNTFEQPGTNRVQRPAQNNMQRPGQNFNGRRQSGIERPGQNRNGRPGANRGERPMPNPVQRPTFNIAESPESIRPERPVQNHFQRPRPHPFERPESGHGERNERPVPAAGPIDAFFNENVVTQPPVHHMSHVHSHSRGHIQSQTVHTSPNELPRVDTMTQNIQTSGQASSITSSSGSKSSVSSSTGSGTPHVDSALSGISTVESALNSVGGGIGNAAGAADNGTHIVHHTEVVETVIETKNQAAAVAKTDTATTANQSTSVSTKGGNPGGVASGTSASSAASASTAVASKQEQVVSTKKTTKTTQIKKGTDANGQPAAVHQVTEVVEHTSAAKTGAATATKTDAAAATSSTSTVGGANGGASGGATKVDSASASSASSGSVTSNNATTTSVKTTIKKTTVTKLVGNGTVVDKAAAPKAAPMPSSVDTSKPVVGDAGAATPTDTYVVDTGVSDTAATLSAEKLAVKALDLYIPSLNKEKKNKKKAKTAILSENNDRQSVGVQAALIATPKPKMAAKIVEANVPSDQTTTLVPTTPEPAEEQTTTEAVITTTEEIEMEEYMTTMSSRSTMGYYDSPITSLTDVAGWAGPTTSSGLGPNDRINTTDVPEEIEARPDKTPAEMRRELAKLNPNLKKQQKKPGGGPRRNSRQRGPKRGPQRQRGPNNKGGPRAKKVQRKRQNLKARRNNANSSRNNPQRRNPGRSARGRGRGKGAGTRPRTADPVARWLWNNLENAEMFENMPFWMLLK